MSNALATYQTGSRTSTFGRIHYELHADVIHVKEQRWNFGCDASVPLTDLRIDPVSRYYVRGLAFKIFGALIVGPLACALFSWLIFKNYNSQFTYWYIGCAALAAIGLFGLLLVPTRLEQVQFKNHSGNPILNIIGSVKDHAALEAFVEAIKTQVRTITISAERTETQR